MSVIGSHRRPEVQRSGADGDSGGAKDLWFNHARYDSLKRLTKAETAQNQAQNPNAAWWGQSFGYDGFGNLISKAPTQNHPATSMSLSVSYANNQIFGSGYDLNGNMTSFQGPTGTVTLGYDVENRSGGHWYDLQNQPLDRAGTWNVYGLHGERLETDTLGHQPTVFNGQVYGSYATKTQASRNVYFGGRLIQSNGATVLTDRVGSVRANDQGEAFEYYPYGEQITTTTSANDREKFGTYTRESATGMDYAVTRYYASMYGRFNAADGDAGSASASSTGSWNRYAYAGGDPINSADPGGMMKIVCNDPTAASMYDGSCNLASGTYGYPGGMGCAWDGSYGFQYNVNTIVPCGAYYFAEGAAAGGGGGDKNHKDPAMPTCSLSVIAQGFGGTNVVNHTVIQINQGNVPVNYQAFPVNKVTGDIDSNDTAGLWLGNSWLNAFQNDGPTESGKTFAYSGPQVCRWDQGVSLAFSYWTNNKTTYYPFPQNSNSFASLLLYEGGVSLPMPVDLWLQAFAPGWGWLPQGQH